MGCPLILKNTVIELDINLNFHMLLRNYPGIIAGGRLSVSSHVALWHQPSQHQLASSYSQTWHGVICEKTNPPVILKPTGCQPPDLSLTLFNCYNAIRMLRNTVYVNYHIQQSERSQHDGCCWPGAYMAPVHMQQSWWRRLVGASQGCRNVMWPGASSIVL